MDDSDKLKAITDELKTNGTLGQLAKAVTTSQDAAPTRERKQRHDLNLLVPVSSYHFKKTASLPKDSISLILE